MIELIMGLIVTCTQIPSVECNVQYEPETRTSFVILCDQNKPTNADLYASTIVEERDGSRLVLIHKSCRPA